MSTRISFLLFFFNAFALAAFGQSDWKQTKNKDGIAVYLSDVKNSKYKSIKVECTFEGDYDKLLSVLKDVANHKDWVYNNKSASLLKTVSPIEFYYYTETSLSWPMDNRDAVMHTIITRDNGDRFLRLNSTAEPSYSPEKSGKVRVKSSNVTWYVTRPTPTTIHIVYTLQADPGGSIPAWMVNSFVDKGPYESFKKLKALLKQ
jgi:hypothetical protein